MDPSRERDSHRILALFAPYRVRLAVVLVMIIASAIASMVSPFLLERAINVGLVEHDSAVLSAMVLGMIGIAFFSQATSVWQTYLSNVVGQRVMHDLRAAVYRHLQRMSLAFFTRTRTGEIQSRIANDIGGLDARDHDRDDDRLQRDDGDRGVSRCASSTGGWPCSRWSSCRRTCGLPAASASSAAITSSSGASWPTVGAHVESLSVSGMMLGKTMGRGDDLADRFRRVAEHRRAGGPQPDGGPLDDGDDQLMLRSTGADLLAGGPSFIGSSISIGTVVAFTSCRPGCCSRSTRCSASRPTWSRRWRSSTASSSTSTCRSTSPRPRIRSTLRSDEVLGESGCEDVSFRYAGPDGDPDETHRGHCARSTWTSPPAPAPRSSARPARARRRSGIWSPGCTSPRGAGHDRRHRHPRRVAASLAQTVGVISQETYLFHASVVRTCASPGPTPPTRRWRTRPGPRGSTS